MSKINVDTWEPESGSAATLMATGDTVTVPSGASLVVASGATINITGATQTGFPSAGFDSLVAITSSQSYTIPSDITKQVFYVTGGGGGGGGANVALGSGSGSAGGTVIKSLSLAAGTAMDIVIGAVAAGGTAGVDGTIGVDTTVTRTGGTAFTTLTAPGGKPGRYGTSPIASVAPSGGDINIAGGAGGPGGGGGSSYWGGGGVGAYYSTSGSTQSGPGLAHGSGGGSGYSTAAYNVASAGAVGIVMIYLYK